MSARTAPLVVSIAVRVEVVRAIRHWQKLQARAREPDATMRDMGDLDALARRLDVVAGRDVRAAVLAALARPAAEDDPDRGP